MAVLLPDTLKTMTENFPAAEAKDVEITLTGNVKKRLQQAYEDGDLGGGEGLMAVETMPANPEPKDTVLYIGEDTASYKNGHIYEALNSIYYCYVDANDHYHYLIVNPAEEGAATYYYKDGGELLVTDPADMILDPDNTVASVSGDSIMLSGNGGPYDRDSSNDLLPVWKDITPTVDVIKDVEILPTGNNIEDILYRTSKNVLTGTERTINVTSEETINSVIADFRAAFPTWTYEEDSGNVYLRCPENEMWDLNDSTSPAARGKMIDNIWFATAPGLWDINLRDDTYYRYNLGSNFSNNFREYTKEFTVYSGSSNNQSLDRIAFYRDIKEQNVISIKSLSELPADSEIPENLEKGNIYILSQNDNEVKAGTMFSVGAIDTPSAVASTYHYKFTNGIKIIYSSSSTIGTNNVYVQSDAGYLFTSLVNISGNTYRPALYKDDTSGVWDFNVNLPSTDEAVPTVAGWVALNEDTTTELAEQALAVASAASLQAKEAKDAITPHFTGTRNEVNAQIAQNKLPDGAYVAVTDDIDQDYDTDYSTNEVKLANKWIDGKPIYRKVVNNPSGIPTGTALVSDVSKMILGIGTVDTGSNSELTIPCATTGGWGFRVDLNTTNNTIILTGYGTIPSGAFANTLILEYTKTTD